MAKDDHNGNPAVTQDPQNNKFHIDQEVVITARGMFRHRHGFVRCFDEFGVYGVDVWNGEDYDALGFHWSELKAVS